MCSELHCKGKGVFNSISEETLALNALGTAPKWSPSFKHDVIFEAEVQTETAAPIVKD